MKEEVEKVLDQIRPSIQLDGGDVEFVEYNEKTGVVSVRMQGACVGCPMSQITLKAGIESMLQKEVPEVKEVISVE